MSDPEAPDRRPDRGPAGGAGGAPGAAGPGRDRAPRPPGAPGRPRAPDYDEKRRALIDALEARLAAPGPQPSLNALAAAAGVTPPTLKHYFGDREAVVQAVLEAGLDRGEAHVARARTTDLGFAESVAEMVGYVIAGFRRGRFGALHIIGLSEGMHHEALGPAYLATILDPTMDALAERLRLHVQRGEMRDVDCRAAALILAAPMLLALLHQDALGGRGCRPMAVEALAAQHAQAFVIAHRR